jgi:hypothetical protein
VNPILNPRSLITLGSQALVLRTVVQRLREVREDGDPLELADALLNAVVFVTGTILIVRHLRRGEEA